MSYEAVLRKGHASQASVVVVDIISLIAYIVLPNLMIHATLSHIYIYIITTTTTTNNNYDIFINILYYT